MGIDSNIALGVKPIQIENPMNALAQMMQIKSAQQADQLNGMKMDEYSRGVESQNRLRQLMGGFGADHSSNQQKLLQGGYLKEAQDYGKNQADIAKAQADIGKTQSETQYKNVEMAHKRIDLMGQVFGYVRSNPSADSAMQATDYLVQNGVMTAEQAAATKAKIAADPSPATIAALATQAYQSALSAKDQLPKLGDFNAGGSQQFTSTDPLTGKITMTAQQPITESANNIANNQRIASEGRLNRGQQLTIAEMTDQRARELNATTKDNKPLTEGQSKSALFGSRMATANKIFDTLEASGTTTSTPGINSGYGIGNVVSALSSADQQQLMQAKRDFLNAILRRESGAVIGESEFTSGEKQYFPQVGDTKQVIAQKKANREASMRGVLVDVPEGRRAEIVREISGGTPSGMPDMSAIDAEIARRPKGGK